MEALLELTSLTGSNLKLSGKVAQLYEAIHQGQVQTDQEALALLFVKQKQEYYYKVRRQLQHILIDHIITNPANSQSKTRAAFEKCRKGLAVYDILVLRGARGQMEQLAKRLLKMAIRYDFIETAYRLSESLMYDAGVVKNNEKNFQYYKSLSDHYFKLLQVKKKVRAIYAEISIILNTSRSTNPTNLKQITTYAASVRKTLQYESVDINVLAYNTLLACEYQHHRYATVIDICNEALAFMDQKGIERQFTFLYKKTLPLIALQQYEEARVAIKTALHLVPKGSFNWGIALFYRLVLCFHEEKFQEGYEIYKAATKRTKLKYKAMAEQWAIVKGMVKFLIKTDYIAPYGQEKFRLGRFLNDTPIFTRDKAGNHINILIIQVLFCLLNRRYEVIIDKLEALTKYVQRYLKGPEKARAKYFIKALLLLPACNFHRSAFVRKTKGYAQKLQIPDPRFPVNPEIEVVPYPVLFQAVEGLLENRLVRSRRMGKKVL